MDEALLFNADVRCCGRSLDAFQLQGLINPQVTSVKKRHRGLEGVVAEFQRRPIGDQKSRGLNSLNAYNS